SWFSSSSGTAVWVRLSVSDSSPESNIIEYATTKINATVRTEMNTTLFFSIFIIQFFKGFFEVICNQKSMGILGKVSVHSDQASGGYQLITVHDRTSIYLK